MKRDMRFQLVAVLLTAGAILWLTSSSLTQVQGSNLDESFDFPTSSATLTGSPIAGATPSGFATYHQTSSSRELAVTVGVNLAAGTVLNVTVNTVAVGNITLNAAKRGSLSLDTSEGDTVPVIAAGATLAVKNGTATVLSGSFVATPTPTPTATPTPRPSVSPTPTPTPRPSPSPTATPTPRPSPSPTASPTPRPTPGPRFYAPLTGAAIGGVTPNGLGVYGSDDDSPSGMELTVFVGMVNLPAGTLLDVVVGTTTAGQITLRTSGRGEFSTHNAVTIAAGTTLTVKNGTAAILSGTFSTTPPPTPTPTPRPSPTPGPSPSPTPTPGTCTMSLSAATYTVAENAGQLTVTVNRTCTVDGASRVSYETERGTASDRTDYTSTSGRLNFAAGETSKTFSVLITDDTIVESAETFRVELEEARGGSLGTPRQAVVTITDNDVAGTAANPLETARFFVQQHYADFLSRPADEAGLAYWSSQIANCGTNASCLSSKRVAVSAAFFIEQEFGDTGYYIYRMYQASYGRKPLYDEFTPDRASLVGGAELASGKDEFAEDWVQRPAFLSAYPESLVPEQFVNRLFDTAGLYGFSAERQAEINAMYAGRSRAAVLQNVIEVSAFKTREYNPAFVQMQYFGYLRRDPDPAGYDFWLGVVNNRQVNNYHGMVCAFITSAEMQSRFSFNVPRSNNECGQ